MGSNDGLWDFTVVSTPEEKRQLLSQADDHRLFVRIGVIPESWLLVVTAEIRALMAALLRF